MEEIFEQFKDKDAFDAYWKEHYVPLTYEDVREAYEDFVKSADKHIFLSDYEESGNVSREDFMDNLSQAAQFAFQDGLTEAFYEKNPEVYENAFALFEAAQMEGGDANIAAADGSRRCRKSLLHSDDEFSLPHPCPAAKAGSCGGVDGRRPAADTRPYPSRAGRGSGNSELCRRGSGRVGG